MHLQLRNIHISKRFQVNINNIISFLRQLLHLLQQSSSMHDNYKVLQETIEYPLNNESENYGILMVNSQSGNRLGVDLIAARDKQLMKVTTAIDTTMVFCVYDLYVEKQRQQAFKFAQAKLESGNQVYIIMCGGDGTVEWVIDQALKSEIYLDKVIFTVLPIGTGNDFAKSTGWGNFKFEVNKEKLEQLAAAITKAKIGQYDIWEVTIECFDTGMITEIKNGKEYEKVEKRITKNFTNYFGVGTDAQISYIAQKLNANSIVLKKIAYGFAGFLSFWMFCGSLTRKIKQMFQIGSNNSEVCIEAHPTQAEMQESQKPIEYIKIGNYDCCFTFINSTSTMELEGVWKTPYSTNSNIHSAHKEQCVDDGFIEIVSYRNQISLCLERALHMAKKVGQGKGPFYVNFKEPKHADNHSVYIHVNGQPYRVQNIKSIKICPSSSFPSSKVRVLFRNS